MLILLMAFFSLTPAFGQPQEDKPAQPIEQKEEPVTQSENKKTAEANATADANSVADANAVTDANRAADANTTADANLIADVNMAADPNVVRARIGKFEGLDEALAQINTESKDEIREWTRGRLDDRLDLALAMQKQVTAEFKFLRELSVKEKAVETTVAIDGILLDRQERFKSVIAELEKNSERLRRLIERQERSRERNSRERTRERPERSRKDTQQ
jgi:ribosome-associated translation inhibitor RaiA